MAGGRPTKYKKEYCQQLINHMGSGTGFPYETFAAEIGVNVDTLYAWEKKHEEFSDAKKIARQRQFSAMYKTGVAGMTGQIRPVAKEITTETVDDSGKPVKKTVKQYGQPYFNASVWIFMMKNCFGWRDKVEFTEDDEIDDMDFGD